MLNTDPKLCAGLCARTETVLRTRHYSPLTTKAYVFWVHRFLEKYWFCAPEDLGEKEVTAFLTDSLCERTSPHRLRIRLSARSFSFSDTS